MATLTHLKCSLPFCYNTVGQHSKKLNKSKQVCSAHRTHKKHEVDAWKLFRGCENKHGKYGFKCVCSAIDHAATLDINHIDGDNGNRNSQNIEVLCKMCHTVVTIKSKHHIQARPDRRMKIAKTGLFDFANTS
jgi:hypothetical protein